MSRRAADEAIVAGRTSVNGRLAQVGESVTDSDVIALDGQNLVLPSARTIVLNKPVGYVCSRSGQGAPTIYELLPSELTPLKSVGRLDKDSSGLIVLTNDGKLAQVLAHPGGGKTKTYQVRLSRPLRSTDRLRLEAGVDLEDGPSRLKIEGGEQPLTVSLNEGRNRQIRRTFATLGYDVIGLHRIMFGRFKLENLAAGQYRDAQPEEL
jgi:pseudouridine synthase